MEKIVENVKLSDSTASENPQERTADAAKKQPYVAPQVKVVKFRMELGFAGSSSLLGANTEEMNTSGWDMGHSQSVSTEEMETATNWGTFN